MKTKIIQIGNSQGIRIPKVMLRQADLNGEVEIQAQRGKLIIQAARRPREGWAEAFREMARHGDDRLLNADAVQTSQWDESEWQWK